MSTNAIVARNKKRERLIKKYEAKRKELKEAGDYVALQKLPRNSSPNRLVSRCLVTGRARGVYKKFGLCRNMFRQLALEGKIPGIRKASW